ncbi:DUF2066 domain-containing protein [Vibrio taketomensis]|uniref:DUF2066 domain-containing protein n=1 Tax=Vibrio taketomensis TaxID=2572923 RepID=UPI00138A58C9|nr:DUF2066 domain-containing protein [Vibrio taketomensis]
MRSLLLLALGLIGFPALALTNVDLYQTEIVLDQNAKEPEVQARMSGMEEVIVRASGTEDALTNPIVQKALKQSSQYIAQLSYGQKDQQPTLKVKFNGPQIDALLTQAQLPTWPAQRSNVLVWFVEETPAERAIAWEHSDSKSLERLKQQAQLRGLPITIPVGDFEDVTGANVSELWGGFALPVGQVSQRYPVDAVLLVRASNNNLRWALYDQAPKTIGVTRQAPLSGNNNGDDAVEKMINHVSDYFAKQSSVYVSSESSESLTARFTSLENAVDFFILERKLQQLNSVASLEIQKIQGNEVTFLVHLLATPEQFEQQVARMKEVTPIAVEVAKPEVPAIPVPAPIVDLAGQPANQPAAENSAEQALPQIIEQVASKPVEVKPTLMFEWHSDKYVAPAQESADPSQTQPAEVEVPAADIDA